MSGYYNRYRTLKPGAVPPFTDEDYQIKEVWHELTPEEEAEPILSRIADLKDALWNTDYMIIKIAEGAATAEDYAEMIHQRQAWREEIRELEGRV